MFVAMAKRLSDLSDMGDFILFFAGGSLLLSNILNNGTLIINSPQHNDKKNLP